MVGRAPNPRDPITNQPLMVSTFDLWKLADAAGFTGHDRVVAVAVALAESNGGDAHATHVNNNGTADFGLWQINSIHTALFNQYDWSVPIDNANMAHNVWQGAGGKWTPWSTYPNAANLQMNKVIADLKSKNVKNPDADPAPKISADDINKASGAVVDATPGLAQLVDITAAIKKVLDPHNWGSVGLVLLGGILILVIAWKMLAADAFKAGNKVLNSPIGKAVEAVA